MYTRTATALNLAILILFATTPQLDAQDTDASADARAEYVAPSYTLLLEGENSGPWRWRVVGGPETATVYGEETRRAPDGSGEQVTEWELRMFAGAALDGIPMQIEEDGRVLVPALTAPPEDLESGDFVSTELGPTAYDSVRWALERGDKDRTIDGRTGEHWVLVVSSWSRQPSGETEIPMETTAEADLWFDPALPFSLVPFAVARGSGFPLGVMDAAVSRYVLRESLPSLRERGLLLHAEISASQLRHMEGLSGPMTLGPQETTLAVSDVRADGSSFEGLDETEPDIDDYVRLDAKRAEALEVSQYLIMACQLGGEASDASSGEGSVAGHPLQARAVFEGGDGEALRLVVATPEEGTRHLACIVMAAPGDATAGSYTAALPSVAGLQAGTPDPGLAWTMALLGDAETRTRSLLLFDSGQLDLESVGSDRVVGGITLEGALLSLPPDGPAKLEEGVELDVSFIALPGN